mgnify:CR=1 FL=1
MGEVILEMKGIDKSFPGVHALDHVDLKSEKAKFLLLWERMVPENQL